MLLKVRCFMKMFLCSIFLANTLFVLLGQNQSPIQNIQQAEKAKTDASAPAAVPVLTPEQAQKANTEAISDFRKYKIGKALQKLRFAIVLLPLLAWLAFVYKGIFLDSSDIKNESSK